MTTPAPDTSAPEGKSASPPGRVARDDLPGGLVHVLRRWEASGGSWQVLESSDAWITLGLSPAGTDSVSSRIKSSRTSVLRAYLAGRAHSSEQLESSNP